MKIEFQIAMLLVTLSGCSVNHVNTKSVMPEYIGMWENKSTSIVDGETVKLDIRIAIKDDGKYKYKRCEMSRKRNKMFIAPVSLIREINKEEILTIVSLPVFPPLLTFHLDPFFDVTYKIDQPPYQENSKWYMKIDGDTLVRSSSIRNNFGKKKYWKCK